MKNRQTVIAALAGIAAGTVIGAGAFYSAQLVSYRYTDQDNFRHIVEKRDLSVGDGQSTYVNTHTAAPERIEIPEKCEGLSHSRLANCIVETLRGENFEVDRD
jgi:hypothetical protein